MFLWEQLGPSHHDRLRALAQAGLRVVAIQLFGQSDTYDWDAEDENPLYRVVTLSRDRSTLSTPVLAHRIVAAVHEAQADHAFLCHYCEPAVFIAAVALKTQGGKLFTMLDSKSDDRPRDPVFALPKRIMMLPYAGALVAGERSARYAENLGISSERIVSHYNTLDVSALQKAGSGALPIGFADRPFLVVARLIPEKNLAFLLSVFAEYLEQGGTRGLVIIGDGPLGAQLRRRASELGLDSHVVWRGRCGRIEVAQAMRRSLALLLPSISETYGLVGIEALAQGLPVIVSRRAGFVDLPIREGREGFLVDPECPETLLEAMQRLDHDEERWLRMSARAAKTAQLGDVRYFVRSVEQLMACAG